jgi:DNA mismatch endonuclease (patch repair protein)
MVDNLSPEFRKEAMRAVKSSATSLERTLFSMLIKAEVSGWRKGDPKVVGNPDVVFPKHKLAIFVDGCFWHGCAECRKPMPKSNSRYWKRKIAGNIKRAKFVSRELKSDRWRTIRVWEHELKTIEDRALVIKKVKQHLKGGSKGAYQR